MKKTILLFLFTFTVCLCAAQQSDSIQISELQLEVKQALLDIEKAEIDRRVEYLQHEQNKFLTVTGIILAMLGLGITIVLFVAGYFMNKSLGEKFDSKEQDMENRMRLLEDRTALRLEKLNLEAKSYEKSLDIIQLKIDEAVRLAVEKVENKTEDETEKFKDQIQRIAAEAKGALEDIQGHSDRAKDLVLQIEKSNGKLTPKLKKEIQEQVEKTKLEKDESEYTANDWFLKGLEAGKKENTEGYNEAYTCFEKASNLAPQSSATFTNRGVSLARIEKYKKAIEMYKKSYKLNPKSEITLYNWGVSLYYIKEYEQAIQKYQKAIELEPAYVDAYINWHSIIENKTECKEPQLQEFKDLLEKNKEIKELKNDKELQAIYNKYFPQ